MAFLPYTLTYIMTSKHHIVTFPAIFLDIPAGPLDGPLGAPGLTSRYFEYDISPRNVLSARPGIWVAGPGPGPYTPKKVRASMCVGKKRYFKFIENGFS